MRSAIINKDGLIECIFEYNNGPTDIFEENGNKVLIGIKEYINFNYKWNGEFFEKINYDIRGPVPVHIKSI